MNAGRVQTLRVDLVASESGELQAPCQMPVHLQGVLDESLWIFFAEKLNEKLTKEHLDFNESNQNCCANVQCVLGSVLTSTLLYWLSGFIIGGSIGMVFSGILFTSAFILFTCTLPYICCCPVWWAQERRGARRNAWIAYESISQEFRAKCPEVELKLQDHTILVAMASRGPDPRIGIGAGRLQVDLGSSSDGKLQVPSHPPIQLQGVLDQILWTSFSQEVNVALAAEAKELEESECCGCYLDVVKFGGGVSLLGCMPISLLARDTRYHTVSYVFFALSMSAAAFTVFCAVLAFLLHAMSRRSTRGKATRVFERICQEHRARYPEVDLQVLLVGCGPSQTRAIVVAPGPAAPSQVLLSQAFLPGQVEMVDFNRN